MCTYCFSFLKVSKSFNELLGVYSTEEKAKIAYDFFLSQMGSASNYDLLRICVKKIDEDCVNATTFKNNV